MTFRPLDAVPSIKAKLSIVIVAAVAIAVVVSVIGFRLGIPVWLRPLISITLALLVLRVFAGGITSPLAEMARAAGRMAAGDYEVTVTATSRDEVGELARSFNRMAAELAEVDQQRRDLVAMVSHELRTPISALQANLENLVDGVAEPDADLLASMLARTERLGRLVSQLLDLSRLESGAVPLDIGAVDAAALIDQVVEEVRLQRPGLVVEAEVAPCGLTFRADGERLHQAVANLVDNAARVDAGPVRIGVSAADGPVRIEVVDRGPGIDPAQRARVFERYHTRGGTGLGLTIARWVVELHGGTITAGPAEPTGCRMVIDLPVVPV